MRSLSSVARVRMEPPTGARIAAPYTDMYSSVCWSSISPAASARCRSAMSLPRLRCTRKYPSTASSTSSAIDSPTPSPT
eukprot:7479885-Pyramimonas_sp.AAC.1